MRGMPWGWRDVREAVEMTADRTCQDTPCEKESRDRDSWRGSWVKIETGGWLVLRQEIPEQRVNDWYHTELKACLSRISWGFPESCSSPSSVTSISAEQKPLSTLSPHSTVYAVGFPLFFQGSMISDCIHYQSFNTHSTNEASFHPATSQLSLMRIPVILNKGPPKRPHFNSIASLKTLTLNMLMFWDEF